MAANQPAVTERLNAQTPTAPGMDREPALTVGGITALVTALIALLVAFGIDVTPDQQATLLTVITVAAPIAAVVWTRYKVYAPKTLRTLAGQAAAEAYQDGKAAHLGWLPRDQLRGDRPGT